MVVTYKSTKYSSSVEGLTIVANPKRSEPYSAEIGLRVRDTHGNTSSERLVKLSWTQPPNMPPNAVDQQVVTEEDVAVAVVLEASDAEGDDLEFLILQAPAHGSLEGVAPQLTYVPAADFSGSDQFSYSVADSGGQAEALVQIEVEPVNDPPRIGATDPVEGWAQSKVEVDLAPLKSDPDHDAAELQWEVSAAEPPIKEARLEGERLVVTAPDSAGSGVVRLVLRDGAGGADSSEVHFVFALKSSPILDHLNRGGEGDGEPGDGTDQPGEIVDAGGTGEEDGQEEPAVLPADFNGDRTIEIEDLFLFADAYGQTGTDLRFDLNGDGRVNNKDFSLLVEAFDGAVVFAGAPLK